MADALETHSPREGDWALVKILDRNRYDELRSEGRTDICFFVDETRGEVFCQIMEWINPEARTNKPGYEALVAKHGFELIKSPDAVWLLRQQIAGKISLATVS